MQITINHLTRMGYPHICVAGIDEGGVHKRPVLASRGSGRRWELDRDWLRSRSGPLELGAVVDLGDVQPASTTPEVEDVVVVPEHRKMVERLEPSAFWKKLNGATKESLHLIFGPSLKPTESRTAAFTLEGEAKASLGMLRPEKPRLEIDWEWGRYVIRFRFADAILGVIAPKVTDLRLWENYSTPRFDRVKYLQDDMEGCLIAVGLTGSKKYDAFPEPRHWLQVNNIFPRGDPLWARE